MSFFADLQKRYGGQITPRVAYGLVGLLAIGLFLAVTELRDRSDMLAQSVADMRAELKVLKDDTSGPLWTQRAKEAAAAKTAWDELDWVAETPGIAAAEIQAQLNTILTSAGVIEMRIQVSGDPIEVRGRRVLRFEAAGIAAPGGLLTGIVKLSTAPKRLVITEITTLLSQGGQPGLVTFIGYATYRGVAPAQPAAGAQASNQRPGGAP